MAVWMAPLAMATASAVGQWLSSREAANASAAERARMQELLDNMKSPNFDPAKLTPEQYAVVGKYVPEVADFVAEVNPTLTKLDEASMAQQETGRAKLAAASEDQTLGRMLSAKAQAAAQAQAQSNSAALKQDYAMRGIGSGGMEFLDRLMAGQKGQSIAAQSTQDAELAAYQERMRNAVAAMEAARAIGDQKYTANANNAGIINSFNARTAQRKQNWADAGANTRNDAQRFNLTNEQDVANKNVGTANQFAQYNQGRDDDIKQKEFDNAMKKTGAYQTQSDGVRKDAYQSAAQTNTAISGAADAGMSAWDLYLKSQKEKNKQSE